MAFVGRLKWGDSQYYIKPMERCQVMFYSNFWEWDWGESSVLVYSFAFYIIKVYHRSISHSLPRPRSQNYFFWLRLQKQSCIKCNFSPKLIYHSRMLEEFNCPLDFSCWPPSFVLKKLIWTKLTLVLDYDVFWIIWWPYFDGVIYSKLMS